MEKSKKIQLVIISLLLVKNVSFAESKALIFECGGTQDQFGFSSFKLKCSKPRVSPYTYFQPQDLKNCMIEISMGNGIYFDVPASTAKSLGRDYGDTVRLFIQPQHFVGAGSSGANGYEAIIKVGSARGSSLSYCYKQGQDPCVVKDPVTLCQH